VRVATERWAGSVDARQTDVSFERIRAWRRVVLDIHTLWSRWKAVRHLNRWISNDDVSTKYVVGGTRNDDDAVRISEYLVIFDDVVVTGSSDYAYTEVVALGRVPVSAQPVRTEPVMGCPAGQSYAPAGSASVSIPDGNVVGKGVLRAADHDDAGGAVRGDHQSCDLRADAIQQADTLVAKTLDQAGSFDDDVSLAVDVDSKLGGEGRPATAGVGIPKPRQDEAVQLQGYARCAERCTVLQ
jgi:hypothetical protein